MLESLVAGLQAVLYIVSTCLLIPVMVALVLLGLWLLLECGGFAAEVFRRRQRMYEQKLGSSLPEIEKFLTVPPSFLSDLPFHVRSYVKALSDLLNKKASMETERIELLLQQRQSGMQAMLDKTSMLVRIGPSIGLMGTLIPMGSGLASLSQGNMAQMSSSLIIAFTTTVAGLLIGVVAYVITHVRTAWVRQDMLAMEMITEALAREEKDNR